MSLNGSIELIKRLLFHVNIRWYLCTHRAADPSIFGTPQKRAYFMSFPLMHILKHALHHTPNKCEPPPGGGGWKADTACSTFPSDRTQGIKTVSNSESAQQEGVGRWGLYAFCDHRALQTWRGSQHIRLTRTVHREGDGVVRFFFFWCLQIDSK